MTEEEWLACRYPRKMLHFIRKKVSDRKLRLFACACCRRAWAEIRPPITRKALVVAEQYADGAVDADVLAIALDDAIEGGRGKNWGRAYIAACWSANQLKSVVERVPSKLAGEMANHAANTRSGKRWRAAKDLESIAQAALLRDLFGNPYRPVTLDPSWLAWNGGTVPTLARAVYEERELPSGHLDPVRLALMADMLENAGCSDASILEHLRGLGPHVRGCWVVDLLLGKG